MAAGRACVGRGSRNKVEGIFVPFLWLQGKEDSSRMTQGQGRGKEKFFQGRRSLECLLAKRKNSEKAWS